MLRSLLPLLLLLPACQCGVTPLRTVLDHCEADPLSCVDAGPVTPPPPTACANEGSVSGRICAPDQQTWVNGARVSIDGTDCNGQAQHLETTSAADGTFLLANVPPGDWTVKAALGAFSQQTPVTVRTGAASSIPDNQLCVAQKAVRIAVVTGSGDRIEDLLTTLRLQFTLFGGDSSTWTTQAEPFLSDLNRLQQFDLVFIDCAAAKASGTLINLGPNAGLIEANLRAYVQQGGSVYSSDWALLFTLAAAPPQSFTYATQGGATVSTPFDAKALRGYAPQTVMAQVSDPGLAAFLGKSTLDISFPRQSGANSLHWGLMSNTTGEVLVSASGVITCGDSACTTTGPTRSNVPLAVRVRVGTTGHGGNVVYTSFHNVAQSGPDVAQVLKYLVLNL